MGESARTRRSYDRVADRYAAEIGDELTGKPLDRALLHTVVELADGGPVLDLGCGPGHVTAFLADHGARVVGVDLSPAMCAIAARLTGPVFAGGDMTELPIREAGVAAVVCMYSVIHLDLDGRRSAYAQVARVLAAGGHALVSFHTSDDSTAAGGSRRLTSWWNEDVDLTFRFLDSAQEISLLGDAGLELVARLDRPPIPAVEHPSRRSYLLCQRRPR